MISTMRQSGDRGTSSLNWFANALWVCVSLCRPDSYDEFWSNLLTGNHRGYFSFPAWDGMGRITLVVNMEGDDLVGFSTRDDCVQRMLHVAHAVGWKAKDELVPMSALPDPDANGNGHITYVGYHVYTKNNVPCVVDGQYVMYPELKRFLTTKSWASITMEASERAACEVLNYAVYAKAFEHLAPVADYCRALAAGWRARHTRWGDGVLRVKNPAVVRDVGYRTGQTLGAEDVQSYLAGSMAPEITERVTSIALAMSSHACGHEWGLAGAEDVMDLIGMTEMDPLGVAADLRCRVPPCWWS
jgi:hypothetical protein